MTDEPGAKTRVRRLAGRNIQRLLDEQGRHQDWLALQAQAHGRQWDQSTVSRFVKGGRALTLEDALSFLLLLNVPLVDLLRGDDTVTLADTEMSAEELRDLVMTGRSTAVVPEAAQPATERLAALLGVTTQEVDDSAIRLWDLTADEELEKRVARSHKAYSGVDPMEPLADLRSLAAPAVDPRRRRAWESHHERAMAAEIAEDLALTSKGRKR